jgi:G3E family GTPase
MNARRGAGKPQDDGEHSHDASVTSVGIEIEGQLDPRMTNEWLSKLLREKGADLFRSKGVLCFKGDDEKCACISPQR